MQDIDVNISHDLQKVYYKIKIEEGKDFNLKDITDSIGKPIAGYGLPFDINITKTHVTFWFYNSCD